MKRLALAIAFVLGTPGLLLAQAPVGQPTPYPVPQESDALLVDLFRDETQSGAAQPVPAQTPQAVPGFPAAVPAPATSMNLPGTPSPVTNPASPGEAVIERSPLGIDPSRAQDMAAAAAPKVTPRKEPSPTEVAFRENKKAWIPENKAEILGCERRNPAYGIPLYHIRCVSVITKASSNDSAYKGNPRVYRLHPPLD
ncbi:MAG: hypothetical protein LBF41_07985 [Deltaproteobacteria bacterium]|jgi:hypothetical protein|nr:hypothetical protein [Deltaproteobacteria bacterium]